MLYCLNPACSHPENPDTTYLCQGCGSPLVYSSRGHLFQNRYLIVECLDKTTFTTTYLAQDKRANNEARLIKRFRVSIPDTNFEKAQENFNKLAYKLSKLNHPQVSKLYEYFVNDNKFYIVEDHIDGESLLTELRQGKLFQEKDILDIFREFLPVLSYLESNKISHSRINLKNIIRPFFDEPTYEKEKEAVAVDVTVVEEENKPESLEELLEKTKNQKNTDDFQEEIKPQKTRKKKSSRDETFIPDIPDPKPLPIVRGKKLVLINLHESKLLPVLLANSSDTDLDFTDPEIETSSLSTNDIYNLGVVCIRLLTECLPKTDEQGNWTDALYDAENKCWLWREKLSQSYKQISERVGIILDTMLQLDTNKGYPSVANILDDLYVSNTPQLESYYQPKPKFRFSFKFRLIPKSFTSIKTNSPNKTKRKTKTQAQAKVETTPQDKPKAKPKAKIKRKPQPIPQPQPKPKAKRKIKPKPKPKPKPEPKPPEERKPLFTRRNLLRLAGLGGIGLITTMGIKSWSKYRMEAWQKKVQTFKFETITINAKGQIIKRQQKQNQFVTFDLGKGIMMEFVSIPAGKFRLGSPLTESNRRADEGPQVEITLDSFYISKYPVTQAQWEALMGKKNNPSFYQGAKLPVEKVSWNDCVEFCQKLSKIVGRECRLPSEAQWEYACRAGTTTPFYFGETITSQLANYNGQITYKFEPPGVNRKQTTDVGIFPPNAFGLYDMHGNVWEWCLDNYHSSYNGISTNGEAWQDGSSFRVLRGGSWMNEPYTCRSASRISDASNTKLYAYGFRVVIIV